MHLSGALQSGAFFQSSPFQKRAGHPLVVYYYSLTLFKRHLCCYGACVLLSVSFDFCIFFSFCSNLWIWSHLVAIKFQQRTLWWWWKMNPSQMKKSMSSMGPASYSVPIFKCFLKRTFLKSKTDSAVCCLMNFNLYQTKKDVLKLENEL